MTPDEQPTPRRRMEWWHRLRPVTRRTVRGTLAVLATGVAGLVFGVLTAGNEASLGPHVAEYSTTLSGEVTIDMGPLGALIIDSPLPLQLGVDVLVKEIPDELSSPDENPVAGLTADLTRYTQFLANPGAAIDDAVDGLVADAVARSVVAWSVLLLLVALGRLAAHGVLRDAARSAWRQQGVPAVSVTLAVALVALPLIEVTRTSGGAGRTSAILAGTVLEDARITGRLATIVDYYGGYVVEAIDENTAFYADVEANLAAAYARDDAPLAPVDDPSVDTQTADAAAPTGGDVTADPGTEPTDGAGTSDGAGPDEPTAGTGDATADDADGSPGAPGQTQGTDAATQGTDGATQGTDGATQGTDGATQGTDDESAAGDDGTSDADRAEPVTLLLVSDLHCNVGMAPVVGAAVELSGAQVLLNTGDTVMGGTSVEAFCVNAFADGVGDDVPVVVADGNHDSMLTAEQERAVGWTVLSGEPVEVAGIRFLGDTDPTLTSLGAPTRPERDETVLQMGERLRETACDARDSDQPVDILMVHSPYASWQSLDAGCVPLTLSGHLHRRIGPWQKGFGVQYVTASTAGAGRGLPTIGPLQNQSVMTVLRWDPDTRLPVDYRLIRVEPDTSVSLTPWYAFPEQPARFVDLPEPDPADDPVG